MPREDGGDKLPAMTESTLQDLHKFFRIDSCLSQKSRERSNADFTMIGNNATVRAFAQHNMASALADNFKSKFL